MSSSVSTFFKLKGSMKAIINDYKNAFIEAKTMCARNPLKTSMLFVFFSSYVYGVKLRPSFTDYLNDIREAQCDMINITIPVRNKKCELYVKTISKLASHGQLRSLQFGLFNIVYSADYSAKIDLVKATLPCLQDSWYEFPKRIVDIGVFGHWLFLNKYVNNMDDIYADV